MSTTLESLVPGRAAQVPASDAPGDVQALVRDAALVLGASAPQARDAARTLRLELERHTVAVVADEGGQALLLCIDLGAGYFSEPARARAALVANLHLFVGAGMAFALGAAGPVLMLRRAVGDAQALADAVRQLDAVAGSFGAPGVAGASGALPSVSFPADTAAAFKE